MNELKVFDYEGSAVRTVMRDGEPWFVLKDVCGVLSLVEPHRVSSRLDEDERTLMTVTDSLGREQDTTVINEPGLYNVILRSDKPEAKAFKRWVTHEVLPSIRKTGRYGAYVFDVKLETAITRKAELFFRIMTYVGYSPKLILTAVAKMFEVYGLYFPEVMHMAPAMEQIGLMDDFDSEFIQNLP
jgi:prophage antirepressor-like protein